MIDGHNDLPWALRELCDGDLDAVELEAGVSRLCTDLPRLREGGVTGQFWSVYVPSTLPGPQAVVAVLAQIDLVHRLVKRYPGTLAPARTADDVERARHEGRVASLIGMEGGHGIDASLAVLRTMHALGVRYMTLTHNHNLPWADSATDARVLGGMSAFGEQVVREMNALGMLVDLSHVSAEVMRHALEVSSAPVIFSHSSARALVDVPRNVPDDVLVRMAAGGGMCMVTFVADFVSTACAEWVSAHRTAQAEDDVRDAHMLEQRAGRPVATVHDVADHVDHVREVAGVEHVGIGGDFDGTSHLPAGLEDVSSYPRLFAELTERGWSGRELELLQSGNALRVLRAAEHSALNG